VQQLDFWSRLNFVEPAARRATIEAAVAAFGLEPFAARRLDRISMGERQRVRLAMTFAHRPDVALLDEPRNSLDEDGLALLLAVVREHRERGGATLWCSPTGEPPAMACDRELLLRDGTINPA
jgi:ABC-type multidrug transport system ATPase subunit